MNQYTPEQLEKEFKPKIKTRTLLNYDRLRYLRLLAKVTRHVPGSQAEVGAYKGGSGMVIAENFKNTYLFDTFQGIPYVNPENLDTHHVGDFKTDFEEVKKLFEENPRVKIYQGVFPRETGCFIEDQRFSLVHIDVDIYQSTKECLEFFYDRMNQGGVIIIDDYNFEGCKGVTKAVDEFFATKLEKPILTAFPQCVIIKE